ncbi:MAG: hypothetical protein JW860_03825 [Sedimentisphaerales bacterium]|nr:hypothetical protein [Sedimentisphaerales bacterium]
MDTGYYLENNSICGPGGFSQARVSESGYIYTPNGYTYCWIWGSYIYSLDLGYTRFYLNNNRIHGPSGKLPWM